MKKKICAICQLTGFSYIKCVNALYCEVCVNNTLRVKYYPTITMLGGVPHSRGVTYIAFESRV